MCMYYNLVNCWLSDWSDWSEWSSQNLSCEGLVQTRSVLEEAEYEGETFKYKCKCASRKL